MAKKSFGKDIRRSILKSRARFLSIMAIIALGVGFFAGINASEPDMILSADRYYKDSRLADFRLVSPLGFKPEDIEAVRQTTGVETIQEGFMKDVFLISDTGTTATARLFSYDAADYVTNTGLSVPQLKEGRLPENSGEIAIETGFGVPPEIGLGSQVKVFLPEGEILQDSLATDTYTVVGRITSPMYLDFERGQTNIGDGSVSFFAYIAEVDFVMDKVTDVFVRTTDTQRLTAYSEAYKAHLDPITTQFESLGDRAIGAETKLLRDELNEGKEELKQNKEKAERELADAEKQLVDAEREIEDGERELAENEAKYTRELEDKRVLLEKGRAELNAGLMKYFEGYTTWLEGYIAYLDGRDQLNVSKQQLDDAKVQIEQGEKDLAEAKIQLDAAKVMLDTLKATLDSLKKTRDALPTDGTGLSQDAFDSLIAELRKTSPELADALTERFVPDDPGQTAQLGLALEISIIQMEQTYDVQKRQYDDGLAQYQEGVAELAKGKREYESGLAQYNSGLATLNRSKVELDRGKVELDKAKQTLASSEAKLTAGEAQLTKGEQDLIRELEEGRQKLAQARVDLAEGRATFEAEKADALAQIADAEEKIRDAERKIIEIPDSWFVLTRDGNPGYSSYGDDARRIGAVAKVFPLFFFLVAALVCLTTMTRMVEEERVQIGTLKALGYSSLAISAKYLIYALAASLVGAFIGLAVGFRLFPGLVMNAYGMMYQIPVRLTPDHLDYALISILLAVVTTVSAALGATLQELRAHPAVLMQPKAPKPGKRIMLERIKPLWRRLSFSHKVTARNIFRYKQRFLMTAIGIAGCTALLVTGFGLRDSINAIMDKQFGEIFLYDGLVVTNTDKEPAKRDLAVILGADDQVKDYTPVLSETVSTLKSGSSRTFEANLIVPDDADAFRAFYDLHERVSREPLLLPDEGAIISEKLAGLLDIKVGGDLTYRDTENRTYTVRVAGIAENYLTHYIYLSPRAFDRLTFRTPVFNTAVFNVEDPDRIDEKAFKERLLSHEGVQATLFTQGIADDFGKTIKSLNLVVLVLILSAGALAFVVLYNLTNINITERIREIATIKVLGFRDKEVSAYVYRENVILTLIGTLGGLALGFVLHRFVMGTMEIDNMMFGKNVQWISYLLSAVLTMAFTVIVNLVMFRQLQKINMVESLKAIE